MHGFQIHAAPIVSRAKDANLRGDQPFAVVMNQGQPLRLLAHKSVASPTSASGSRSTVAVRSSLIGSKSAFAVRPSRIRAKSAAVICMPQEGIGASRLARTAVKALKNAPHAQGVILLRSDRSIGGVLSAASVRRGPTALAEGLLGANYQNTLGFSPLLGDITSIGGFFTYTCSWRTCSTPDQTMPQSGWEVPMYPKHNTRMVRKRLG